MGQVELTDWVGQSYKSLFLAYKSIFFCLGKRICEELYIYIYMGQVRGEFSTTRTYLGFALGWVKPIPSRSDTQWGRVSCELYKPFNCINNNCVQIGTIDSFDLV